MIISDSHKNIKKVIKKVFPLASHDLCRFHMKQNVTTKFRKDKKVIAMFELTSRVYRMYDFDHQMEELDKINSDAYDYLIDTDIHKWACAHSPVRRYHMMTTNIAESMNSLLRFARKLPICTLVDFLRSQMQKMVS